MFKSTKCDTISCARASLLRSCPLSLHLPTTSSRDWSLFFHLHNKKQTDKQAGREESTQAFEVTSDARGRSGPVLIGHRKSQIREEMVGENKHERERGERERKRESRGGEREVVAVDWYA